VEDLDMSKLFWAGRRVLVTGHTGFKGGWLALWLQRLGARVHGLALPPPTTPALFDVARIGAGMESHIGDIRDGTCVADVMRAADPEVVFHLAAQPLVRRSYADPVETYSTNVMGTLQVLEAVRRRGGVRAVVVVTSDKCYENREWSWGYREIDRLGGFDPYSNSKGCAELMTAAYRNSFFPVSRRAEHGVALATARAGNVIGGGDWAEDRLIPDSVRAIEAGRPIRIRNPDAVRPWQHVLDPLAGYLSLAERLYENGAGFAEAWNFGPSDEDARPVRWVVERFLDTWGQGNRWEIDGAPQPHEATYLKLDCSKARARLNWRPRMTLAAAVQSVCAWHHALRNGEPMRERTLGQIEQYESDTAPVENQ
jgi:CDP-glucose 4,6-dehydratase